MYFRRTQYCIYKHVMKEFWQKATSPSCQPSRRRMDSSALDTRLIIVPWAHRVSSQTASRSVHLFLHSSTVCPTHRDTDHAVCDICRNRPYLCYACDAT